MKLSHLSETLIGSEIVKLGGEIREKIRRGERIFNFTVGDFDPSIFPTESGRFFADLPADLGMDDLLQAFQFGTVVEDDLRQFLAVNR